MLLFPLGTGLPPFSLTLAGQRQRLEAQPPSFNKSLHCGYPHLNRVCTSHFERGIWEPRLGQEGPGHGVLQARVYEQQLRGLPCPSEQLPHAAELELKA